MNKIIRRISVFLLMMTVAACAGGANKRLPVSHDLGPVTAQTGNSVKVTLDAPVWLWDERIRYRLLYRDATAVRYYNLDRWEAPLPALLEQYLTISGDQAVIVRIQLHRFEQQFVTQDNTRVVMDMTVEARSKQNYGLLGEKSIVLSQATGRGDASGAIAGFSDLVKQARIEIQYWLENP